MIRSTRAIASFRVSLATSPLTSERRLRNVEGGRCGWALLIWAGGAALVGYGRLALGHLAFEPDRHPEVGHWLVGVKAALVVGVLSRSRLVRGGSAALTAMSAVVTAALRAVS
ncbi:hypothetical protein [Micromonospora marina]|uniref:hypothetical protein n=1 Tax=Micromonospora marina TaxID=307120 RepID=UPI003D73F7CA